MTYGNVPHFDKPVSRIVMGVIPLGGKTDEEAFALLDAYREMGGNIIDNSYHYGAGLGEKMGRYYESRGEDALFRFDKGNHHHYPTMRLTREAMDEEIRGNLERQKVGWSDFYVMHRDDENVPIGEVIDWLNEHKEAGRIKVFGGSNWTQQRIEAGNAYAEANGLQGFSCSSPNLSLAVSNEEMWTGALSISEDAEAREWYARTGFPLFPWSSGGGGFYARAESGDIRRVYHNETNFARLERADKMAAEKGVSTPQIALAWTLNQPG
ncbi:aldo/keto reductase, partial [bacterium]